MEKIRVTITCDGCGKVVEFSSIWHGTLVGRDNWIELSLPPNRTAHACSKECAIDTIKKHVIKVGD